MGWRKQFHCLNLIHHLVKLPSSAILSLILSVFVNHEDFCGLTESFTNVLQIYFIDGRTILSKLLEVKESNNRIKHLESDITFHIGKKEAELALRVNSAAHHGDLYHLKCFVCAGADLNKTDYDG